MRRNSSSKTGPMLTGAAPDLIVVKKGACILDNRPNLRKLVSA